MAQQISSTKPTTPRNSIDVVFEIAADHRVVHRLERHRPALVEFGILARQALGHRGQIRLRRFDRRRRASSGRRPAADRPPRARGGMLGGNGRIAHIEVRPRISNSFGITPTTVHSSPSSLMLAADDRRIAIEARFPVALADHDAAAPSAASSSGRERAAGNRLDAEHVEDARRHPLPRHRFSALPSRPAITMLPIDGRVAGDGLERAAARLPVEHVRRRREAARRGARRFPDRDELTGIARTAAAAAASHRRARRSRCWRRCPAPASATRPA